MAGEDILRMAWGGVEVGVIPTPHLMSGLFHPQTLIELWDKTLGYMIKYAASMGIDCYVGLSVPFYGLTAEGYDECLKKLPEYLKENKVVCIGEIGLDVDNEHERRLFKEQLDLAKKSNLPIVIHTPTPRQPQTPDVTPKIIDVLKSENFPMEKAILDHTGKNTLDIRLNSGAVTGLSICYDKLTAEEAAEIVISNKAKSKMILLGSELGYGGAGHLSLVKVAWAMRMEGLNNREIEEVTWENPKRIFNLPIK
jgi:predicted metal-dependent TIM-barrel fold hydrolase